MRSCRLLKYQTTVRVHRVWIAELCSIFRRPLSISQVIHVCFIESRRQCPLQLNTAAHSSAPGRNSISSENQLCERSQCDCGGLSVYEMLLESSQPNGQWCQMSASLAPASFCARGPVPCYGSLRLCYRCVWM